MRARKKRAIVFTLSSDLAFSVACVMLDIQHFSPNIADEIVIIHNGIMDRDQRLLNAILPTRFIEYDFPIQDMSIFNQGTLSTFSKMVFAKFECLKLLNDYDSVLLTDSDVVIQQDISELFDLCESGVKFMRIESHTVSQQCHFPIDDYDMMAQGISAGLFVFQKHLGDYDKMYEFCYKALEKYATHLRLPEQAIFDLMIQEFHLDIFKIDYEIYSPHPTNVKLANKAKIIHAYGQPKFWNGIRNLQWNKNYKAWLDMGGTKFTGKSLFSRVIRKMRLK